MPTTYGQDIIITGHRGAAGHAPENTMAGILKGIQLGAHQIEIDVQQTRDKRIVALHDRDISRTTNGNGPVDEFTWDSLKQFTAGQQFKQSATGTRIPLLETILDTIKQHQVTLLIEVKHGSAVYPGIEKRIAEIIMRKNAANRVIVQSFRDDVLETFAAINPPFPLQKLLVFKLWRFPVIYDGKLRFRSLKHYNYTSAVNPLYRYTGKAFIRQAHKLGLQVHAWTVNDTAAIAKMLDKGVDGIITNYPERVKAKP